MQGQTGLIQANMQRLAGLRIAGLRISILQTVAHIASSRGGSAPSDTPKSASGAPTSLFRR
eukprot:11640291-Alexandrium_andersonii.AAC.1